MAKIAAVVPAELRLELDSSPLLVGPGGATSAGDIDMAALRLAIRQEHKLDIRYRDASGKPSQRCIWPFALGFFDRVQVVVAFCELRQDLRHFRADRIAALTDTGQRYPRRRQALLKDWREREAPGHTADRN